MTMPSPLENPPAPRPAPDLLRHPVQFLAFGFGSGLSPRAPGTAGTLVAVPLYLLFAEWSLLQYTLLVLVSAVLGVWICGAASRQLQVHDHPGIVWDEFVGYWITMWAVPVDWRTWCKRWAKPRMRSSQGASPAAAILPMHQVALRNLSPSYYINVYRILPVCRDCIDPCHRSITCSS